MGYPIRPSTDQWMFAPPRCFSQLATAFFALIRQGIRHKPFIRLTILLFRQNLFKFVKYKINPYRLTLYGVCIANSKIKRVAFYHPSLNCVFYSQLFVKYQFLMGRGRVELPTPALSEQCSNRLSYRPGLHRVMRCFL